MPSSHILDRYFPVQPSTTDGVPFYPPERERFSNTGSTIVDLQGIPTPRLFGYLRYLHKTDGKPTSLHVIVRMYSRQKLICYVTEDYPRLEWNKHNAGPFVVEDHPNISERETQTPLKPTMEWSPMGRTILKTRIQSILILAMNTLHFQDQCAFRQFLAVLKWEIQQGNVDGLQPQHANLLITQIPVSEVEEQGEYPFDKSLFAAWPGKRKGKKRLCELLSESAGRTRPSLPDIAVLTNSPTQGKLVQPPADPGKSCGALEGKLVQPPADPGKSCGALEAEADVKDPETDAKKSEAIPAKLPAQR